MNWKHVSLGEISVNIQTGPFGSQLHQSDYSEKGTPVVMPKDLISGHISEESIARVSDDHVERLSRHKIEVGDILYSRRGDVGRCAFASETEAGWLCGTGCLRVTIDSRKANPKFVFYQLLKADTIGWVEKHAVGSTMLNLNTSILSSVPIDLPSHDKQNHMVISQEQNEIQTFQKWGLDIKYHREKMEKRELDKEFKDPANPLRVVFVCAMWLTGFDVKCLSCLYLDKPLKAHTLMQTIARANRVAEGKSNGLIIDYIGIVKALRKALADYTANVNGNGGSDPTVDKEKLISRILETIAATEAFLDGYGFSLQTLINAKDFEKLALLQTAADAVSATIEEKKTFQTYAAELIRLMKYTNHEDIEPDIRKRYEAIAAIYGELKKKRRTVTNVDLMVEINHIISEYVQIEQATDGITLSRQFDISKIDFDLLRREFAKAKKKNLIMKDLQELIRVRLDAMLFNNPDRIKYHERYQEIIEDYNSQQDRANIEKTFDELMDLVQNMDQEERRYVREGFSSDEELSLYDMLFSENLSKQDIQKIKKVAVDLLQKVKSKIAELDHWTDKQETKATIDTLIRDTLWLELPECYDELRISEYRQRIYEYVYTRYKGVA